MKRRVAVTLMLCILLPVLGCNPKVGLVTLDTRPSGATAYVNDSLAGDTPVTFEFDLEKPVTLKILKDGYEAKTESLNVGWARSEYHQGHYAKGEYMIKGKTQESLEIRTIRDLVKAGGG